MAEIQTKRYPVRGALWGLLLGVAIAYFATFEFAWVGFDELSRVGIKVLIIIGVTMVVGILWAYVAPARKPKGPAPAGYEAETPPPAPADEMPPPAPVDETPPAAVTDEEPPTEPTT